VRQPLTWYFPSITTYSTLAMEYNEREMGQEGYKVKMGENGPLFHVRPNLFPSFAPFSASTALSYLPLGQMAQNYS